MTALRQTRNTGSKGRTHWHSMC